MIVGLSGLKGVGKDTAAAYLRAAHGFVQFALADLLYTQVAAAFGVSEHSLRSREWKTTVRPELALRNCDDFDFVRTIVASEMPNIDCNVSPFCSEAQTCPRTSTFIVQRWATEYRRAAFGDGYWVDLLMPYLEALPRGSRVVISDVREDHEVELLEWFTNKFGPMKCGIARLVNHEAVHTGHRSDNGLSRQYVDRIITSTPGDIAGLHNQLDLFISEGMKWKPLKK